MTTSRNTLIPGSEHSLVVHHPSQPSKELNGLLNVAVFPGSFNPLHHGHRKLRQVAELILRQPVYYEISLANAAKASIDQSEILRRLQQFDDAPAIVTRAPRFVDKARLFHGCCFVVGVDTAERILSSSFYNDSESAVLAALQQFLDCGHRFLVGGRLDRRSGQHTFLGLKDLEIPHSFRDVFIEIPEAQFREDISSTEIRQ